MGFNFPSAPTIGQAFDNYVWDGEKWVGVGTPGAYVPEALSDGNLRGRKDAAWEVVQKKNYILNGALQFGQEWGVAAATTTGWYPADGFLVHHLNTGTQTIALVQSPTPRGSPNRLRITATVADAAVAVGDYLLLRQTIESVRAVDLRLGTAAAKTVTLSFGVKAPAGTYTIALRNAGGNRDYITEYVIAPGEANTDVVKSVTIPLDQTGTWTHLEVTWMLMAGTTYHTAPNVWSTNGNGLAVAAQFNLMGTINNVFELFDIGLYEGTVAPPFVVPDFDTEYLECERYFQFLDVAIIGGYASVAGNAVYHTVSHRTEMRAVPTISAVVAPTLSNATLNVGGSGQTARSTRFDVSAVAAGQFLGYAGVYKLSARL